MTVAPTDISPAPGFTRIEQLSPFSELNGPFYVRGDGLQRVVGLRVLEKHCNRSGIIHGGMLSTLVDLALGTTLALLSDPPRRVVTANLSIDFAGSAMVGDWLEVHIDVQKSGNRLSFANCYVHLGEQRIVRASAVFATSSAARAHS